MKNYTKGILIVLFSTAFCFQALLSQTNGDSKKFDQSLKLFNENKYSDALKIFQELIAHDATNANLQYHAGICYLKSPKEISKSLDCFENASKKITPNYLNNYSQKKAPVFVYYYYGTAYQFLGNYKKALEQYNFFISNVKNSKENEYADILNDITLQTEICEYKFMLASDSLDAVKTKDKKLVQEFEKRKIKLTSKANEESFYKQAIIEMNDDNYAQALPKLLSLETNNPSNKNISYLIGICYLEVLHEKNLALTYFDKCKMDINPNYKSNYSEQKPSSKMYYYYGVAYQMLEECEKAVTFLNKYKTYLTVKDTDEKDEIDLRINLCNNTKLYPPFTKSIEESQKPLVTKKDSVKPVTEQNVEITYLTDSLVEKEKAKIIETTSTQTTTSVTPNVTSSSTTSTTTSNNSSTSEGKNTDKNFVYGVQIASLNNNKTSDYLKRTYNITEPIIIYFFKGAYKYTIGQFKTVSEAQEFKKELCKKLPSINPFMIKIKNGNRVD